MDGQLAPCRDAQHPHCRALIGGFLPAVSREVEALKLGLHGLSVHCVDDGGRVGFRVGSHRGRQHEVRSRSGGETGFILQAEGHGIVELVALAVFNQHDGIDPGVTHPVDGQLRREGIFVPGGAVERPACIFGGVVVGIHQPHDDVHGISVRREDGPVEEVDVGPVRESV